MPIQKICNLINILPLNIVLLYFMSKDECSNHHLNMIFKFSLLFFLTIVFYYTVFIKEYNKELMLIITIILFYLLVYLRQKHDGYYL